MSQQTPQQFGSQEQTYQQSGSGMQSQQPPMGHLGQQYSQPQQPAGQHPGQMGQPSEQTGGQSAQMGSPGGIGQQAAERDVTLEAGISDEMRVALHDFIQAANVCEWCAEQCIDEGPEMAECIRLCRDVADLATLNVQLLTRDSVFGPELAEVFVQAADACAQECAQHHHRHCQECADVLPRAARSTRKMLASFGGGGMGPQQAQFGTHPGGQF